MKKPQLNLKKTQWRFLATIEALGGNVHIDVLDIISPLAAGQFVDLLKKTPGILENKTNGVLILSPDAPEIISKKIRAFNNQKALSLLVDMIHAHKIERRIGINEFINILEKIGRMETASRIEFEEADKEFSACNLENALRLLRRALVRFKNLNIKGDDGSLFILYSLKFANLCFVLGRDITELTDILNKAQSLASQFGDIRSLALINFYTGLLYYLTGRRDDAFSALSIGLEVVSELGDEDIISQSAESIGLFYFMKGEFEEAMKHLELVENRINNDDVAILPITYALFGFSALYLGHFHRAIGFLDTNLKLAEEKDDKGLSSILRSILGTALLLVKKYKEAESCLIKARQEAIDSKNVFGHHFSGGGLCFHSYLKGDMEDCYKTMEDIVSRAAQAGLINQYESPWICEIFYEFDRLGFPPIQGIDITEAMDSALNGVNIHLRGIGLRIRAQQKMDKGDKDKSLIMPELEASRECLVSSGNRIQMAKTVLEMAHLELLNHNREKASKYAQEAWRIFGGHAADFFPDQYKGLLDKSYLTSGTLSLRQDLLSWYFKELNAIMSSIRQDEVLHRTVVSTNSFFGAERGALFWFSNGSFTAKPELRAASNLTSKEVRSSEFKPFMDYVLKALKSGKPIVVRNDPKRNLTAITKRRSVLCIPINVDGATRGVLYHDNSYMQDAFDHLDPSTMTILSRHTSEMVNFLIETIRVKAEKDKLSRERLTKRQEFISEKIIAKSDIMLKALALADNAAGIDTNILLLGETGTGKGVFARWIHENSHRKEGPFIVVDCTTIPENLFESELFGYEKGAFTGADKQKLGRIELSRDGTLFLDEIGELPLNIQKKLLKTLEEKTFVRIGGGRSLKTDFRLIVATNRNLANEVSTGLFREDLYYRINVFPISLPPLRKRKLDIIKLARYFVEKFSKEHGRAGLYINRHDENMLTKYTWPGNVRELQNVIERAVILSNGVELEGLSFPSCSIQEKDNPFDDYPTLDELQRRYIRHILAHTRGKISGQGGAAEILGIKRTAVYSRMKALGMKK